MEIPTHGGQAVEQGREVFEVAGDEVARLALALPHATHGQQARAGELGWVIGASSPAVKQKKLR